MLEPKPDRRVQRTRELLLDALVQLLMERGYEKLTVQNLLDRAGVGRATFYAHFQGKDELLASSIARLQSGLGAQWRSAAKTKGEAAERLGFSLPFFLHLDSHRRIYHTTICRDGEWTIELHMQRMLRELVREDLQRFERARSNSAAIDLAVGYVVATLWAVVEWWLGGSKPVAPEEVNQIFQRLAFPGLDALIGSGR